MLNTATIDESLARGIRRAYFRALDQGWNDSMTAMKRARQRNRFKVSQLDTDKQLRACVAELRRLTPALLPVAEIMLQAGSRSANVTLSLMPAPLPLNHTANSNAAVTALVLARPGGIMLRGTGVVVSGHAVDRVIQRTRLMELPISREDIAAINAEFTDALPLACIGAAALSRLSDSDGPEVAESLQVLLPASHGVFLANWSCDDSRLIIKTFISRTQLNDSQQMAAAEFSRLQQGVVESHVLDEIAPGWLNIDPAAVHATLIDAWRRYGWRFDVERLHPGLSDAAWAELH